MCGRYIGNENNDETMKTIYRDVRNEYPELNFISGDIFPTNLVPVVAGENIRPMPSVWGFPGFGGKGVIINARAETVTSKPFFADSVFSRRCAIPATGYYEWSPKKEKFLFTLAGETFFYMAGFYKSFADGNRFVIITTAATPTASAVHERMPLLLTRKNMPEWILSRPAAFERLASAINPEVEAKCV